MRDGTFREDLYYRLAAFPIRLPPLRERRDDVPLLADRFLAAAARRHGKRVPGFTPAALASLVCFAWPGNVRQLQNEIERAVVLAQDGETIDVSHLSEAVGARRGAESPATAAPDDADVASGAADGPRSLQRTRHAFEAHYIAQVLEEHGGNVSRAARTLGLSRVALHRKMKEYGVR
jgi:two-component system response regulator HupR/HoxA